MKLFYNIYKKKWIKIFLLIIIILIIFSSIVYIILPDIKLLDDDKQVIKILFEQRETDQGSRAAYQWVPLRGVPYHLQKAVLASEDTRFFSHHGIDIRELFRSLKKNYRRKRICRGGSTITMQAARNLYLKPEKSYLRKVKEILIALKMELLLSKKRILEIYLNIIEFGENIIGIESASKHYFYKSTIDLNKIESVRLAAIIPNPKEIKIDSKYVFDRISYITNEMRFIHIK